VGPSRANYANFTCTNTRRAICLANSAAVSLSHPFAKVKQGQGQTEALCRKAFLHLSY
jgi:hypothetical protein